MGVSRIIVTIIRIFSPKKYIK